MKLKVGDIVRFTKDAKRQDPFGYILSVDTSKHYMVAENDGSKRGPIRLVFFHLYHKRQEEGWFHPDQFELVSEDVTEGWTL